MEGAKVVVVAATWPVALDLIGLDQELVPVACLGQADSVCFLFACSD